MWAYVGQCLRSSSPKQWKSDGSVKIYNSVSERSPLTKSKKKNYRERSNIKSAHVSALTGSMSRKMAWCYQAFQNSSGIEPKLPNSLQLTLTTKPLVCIKCPKETVYDSLYFVTCNRFVWVQDWHTLISQVEYQGQTRNTRILECKPLIDTSDRIRHRLELKYFHFAQFLLNAHQAAHRPRKSENW